MKSYFLISFDLTIIFLNFIWSQMIPNFYIISYVYVSYEKREYKNNMEIFNQTRHFFICQSSFISFKSLTSLKTASKNYTWKVCVLPQQNAFGKPFSLKKHEVYVTRHPEFPNIFEGNACPNLYFLGRNAHSWFFTNRDTSRFFQGELRPFDDQRNRRLTENFAWFGSIQGLEINAQTWRLGVRLRSCGTPQTRKFLALWGRETGRGQQSPHAWRPCPTVKGSADKFYMQAICE